MASLRKLDVALAGRTKLVVLPAHESFKGFLACFVLGIELYLAAMAGESGEGSVVNVQVLLTD